MLDMKNKEVRRKVVEAVGAYPTDSDEQKMFAILLTQAGRENTNNVDEAIALAKEALSHCDLSDDGTEEVDTLEEGD